MSKEKLRCPRCNHDFILTRTETIPMVYFDRKLRWKVCRRCNKVFNAETVD